MSPVQSEGIDGIARRRSPAAPLAVFQFEEVIGEAFRTEVNKNEPCLLQ